MFISAFIKRASLLAAIFGGAAAQGSIFFIQTIAEADVGDEGAKMTYDSRFGATLTQCGCAGFTYTSDGSPNVLGLTSSFDRVSDAAPGGLPPFPIVTASAYSSADLASGSIRFFGGGNLTRSTNGAYGYGNGNGTAYMVDQLTFHVSGANAQTITPIGVNYRLDGTTTIIPDPISPGGASYRSDLVMGIAEAFYGYNPNNVPAINTYLPGWASDTFTATPELFNFRGVYNLQGSTIVVPISLKVNYDCQGATCDFTNTGVIDMALPGNVTYTSDSGVFLTQPLSQVPEPASWALIAGAMAAACVGKRGKRG